jgi:hypothetical protein
MISDYLPYIVSCGVFVAIFMAVRTIFRDSRSLEFKIFTDYDDGTGEDRDALALIFINHGTESIYIQSIEVHTFTKPWKSKGDIFRLKIPSKVSDINDFNVIEVPPHKKVVEYLQGLSPSDVTHETYTVTTSKGRKFRVTLEP